MLATLKQVKWQKQQKKRKMRDQSMLSPSFPRFTATISISKWRWKTGIQKKAGDLWWGKGKEEKKWNNEVGKKKIKVWLLSIDNKKKIRQEKRKILCFWELDIWRQKIIFIILAWPSCSCEVKYAMMIVEPSVFLTLQRPAFSQVSFPKCFWRMRQWTMNLVSLLLHTPASVHCLAQFSAPFNPRPLQRVLPQVAAAGSDPLHFSIFFASFSPTFP